MLGKRGPPYSALIYSVDASGFEQTDVNNSKIVRRSHICGFAMMHVTLQLQSQRVVFGGRLKSQIIVKHKSFQKNLHFLLVFEQSHTVQFVNAGNILNSEKLVIILALFPCDITLSYAPNPEKIPFNDVLTNLTNPYGYDCGYYRDEEITFCL